MCKKISHTAEIIDETLEGFSNKIIKIKSDFNVDIKIFQQKNKSFETKIDAIYNQFSTVGKIISSFCELFLLQFSLSF